MAALKVFGLLLCALLVQGELNSLLQVPQKLTEFERIIQGHPATSGQFPHQVHLQLFTSSGSSAYCGGSLISTRHVLTAAHCASGMVSVNVRMGTTSLSSGTVVTSRSLTMHPQYNPNLLHNDLAIITLPSAITESSTIKVIRLPKRSELSVTHAGKTATVSGWGRTTNTGSISQTLNWVNLKVDTNSRCTLDYNSQIIISSTICCLGIESPAQSTCQGDSGGPLILRDTDGQNTLIGVVSFVSSLGCSSGRASGYVRTVYFLDWINQVTGIPVRP